MDTFTAAVMSMPGWKDGEDPILYHTPTGELRVGDFGAWAEARPIDVSEYPLVRLALIDRLQSEIRYGAPRGASLLQRDRFNVLRHSLWVRDRCEQLAECLGLSPIMVKACGFVGGRHDLHEALPGIRDLHGPALRWYRSVCPELDSAHRIAERTVARLIAPWPEPLATVKTAAASIASTICHYADKDAMAVERALLFLDRPRGLKDRVDIVDAARALGYDEACTPYFDKGTDLVACLDRYLIDPMRPGEVWDRLPVSDREISSLRSWYKGHACNAPIT